jgi:hypothetical protein
MSIKAGLGDENSNWSHGESKLAVAPRERQSGLTLCERRAASLKTSF